MCSTSILTEKWFRGVRTLAQVDEIDVPDVGVNYLPRYPRWNRSVTEDKRVRVSAVLVPHSPVYSAVDFSFDTVYRSEMFRAIPRTRHVSAQQLPDRSKLGQAFQDCATAALLERTPRTRYGLNHFTTRY